MSKKIGLITFHDTTNFGSLLQTYGLYKKILDLNYEIDVIDYTCNNIKEREIPHFPAINKNFLRMLVSYILFGKIRRKKYDDLNRFLNTKMTLSEKINDKDNLEKLNNTYGTFVCGSDLIWDLKITDNDYSYFLDFASRGKNIFSFASAGSTWNEQQKGNLRLILEKFKSINVRDDGTASRVKELSKKEVNIVCDPTMLLETEQWNKIADEGNVKIKDYILIYFLDDKDNVKKYAEYIAQKTGKKIYVINYGRRCTFANNISPTSIEEFLSLIKNASYIVTSSYHGLLFSLYFNKEFWFYNRAHKDRMKNIINKVSIKGREIKEDSNYEELYNTPIDYEKVNSEIEDYRNYSVNILKKALKEI